MNNKEIKFEVKGWQCTKCQNKYGSWVKQCPNCVRGYEHVPYVPYTDPWTPFPVTYTYTCGNPFNDDSRIKA